MLPFTTQKLTQSCDIVISASVVTDLISCGPIISSLYMVGSSTSTPVIPAFLSDSSIDDLSSCVTSWVTATLGLISIKTTVNIEEIRPLSFQDSSPNDASDIVLSLNKLDIQSSNESSSNLSVSVLEESVTSAPSSNVQSSSDRALEIAKKSTTSNIFSEGDKGNVAIVTSRGKGQGGRTSSIVFG